MADRWLPMGAQQAMLIRLEAIEQRIEALDQNLRAQRGDTDVAEELATLREALAAIEKQIGRAGREQFKANTLAEAQSARLDTALEALQTADARREAEQSTLREQSRSAQASARLDIVRSLLPTLDGLDEALRSGQRLLAATDDGRRTTDDRRRTTDDRRPAGESSFVDWLFGRAPAPPVVDDALPQQDETLRESLDSWLVGLTFVRQRLLDTLAAEGVRPMDAEGQPFDPQRHIALEALPAANGLLPGTVAAELRRGYMVGERVLRHAEVAVATDDRRPTTDDRRPTTDDE